MADLALSRLFERYRSGHDLAALAEVFDRVSPDLLRVARHVASRGVEPEDLIQATFLAAIERAETFDAERPLLPWLLGILVNQSRRVRRRENLLLPEASAGAIPARPDSEHDAESHEFDAAVERALAELPENYREVLVPHLSQGKDPHVIARELGRPQGTVRAQIHRGLRLMRRMLPSGFALGGYAAVSSDAISLVRQRVLEDGARRIGHGSDAVAQLAAQRAARTVRRNTTLAGTAGILGVALWFAWPDSEASALAPSLAVESPAETALEELDVAAGRDRLGRAPLVPAGSPVAAAVAAQEYGSVVVNVREFDADTPAAGVRVSLLSFGAPRWFEHIREARSDANGTARFEHVHAGRVAVHVERGEQSRGNVDADKETPFMVRCPRTIALEALVTETNGRPIAGAKIDVHARRDEAPLFTSAPTDALGRVRIDRAPNECFLAARADGHVTSNMSWAGMNGSAKERAARFTFELANGGLALEGIVVDERGASIADARILASSAATAGGPKWRADGTASFEPAPLETKSDANGRFRIDGLDGGALRLCVEARGRATSLTRVEPRERRFETVQLGPGATLKGVTRLADGSPAITSRVEVVVAGEPLLHTQSGLDGSYVLEGLPCGRVTARARVGAYGPFTSREITLAGGEPGEWSPTLVGAETIEGRAIGQDGRPISTWLVLATPETPESDPAERLAHWSRQQVPAPVDDLAVQSWIYSTGVFVVPCRSSATHRIELRARAAWRDPPQTYVAGVQPGARDVLLRVVRERGRIQGRFVDENGRVVAMERVIAVASGATGELPGAIDANSGRFDIETLAGTYELLAWTAAGAIHHFGTVDVPEPRIVELGDRVVRKSGEIVITTPDVEFVSLELLGASGLSFELVPVAEKTWRAKALQPGTYTLRTTSAAGRVSEERIELAAGSVARVVSSQN